MAYLNINQIKYAQNLCTENYKTLLSEIKEDLKSCKDVLHSWIERPHIVLVFILKLIFKFNAVSIKIPANFFYKSYQADFKINTETQKT